MRTFTPPPSLLPHPAPDERGFILVGVVTFMLALTILGLSLFALSSYEAQFFMDSVAREQSLQNSESGMELVKASLAAPGSRLEYAHRAEGQSGVTSAMAYQKRSGLATDTTSQGPVDWDSTVVIVVAARSGGVERSLQATFIPGAGENPYQRLLVAGSGVTVNTENSSSPSVLQLSGRVWQPVQSGADTSWTDDANWISGRPIESATPPVPFADAFVDANLQNAPVADSDFHDQDDYEISFMGSPGSPTFFRSPASPTHAGESQQPQYNAYTFYVGDDLRINVRGIVVWVLPNGACFKNQVTVDRVDTTPSTLVIVAKANGNDPGNENVGIWFKGGLRVADSNLQVYLVSQGDVAMIHHYDEDQSHDARDVSIVAGGRITIGGPNSGDTFRLGYDPSSMDALADQLLAMSALPQVAGGAGKYFTVARQTWVETTPR